MVGYLPFRFSTDADADEGQGGGFDLTPHLLQAALTDLQRE